MLDCLIFNVLFFRVKEILYLNKQPYFPQDIFQPSSASELKRKTAFRNTLLGLFEILFHISPPKNDPQTQPFFKRQLIWNNLTLQKLHHWTSPWQCWFSCLDCLLTDPNCRNPNWSCAKPQGLLRQQKCPEQPCCSPAVGCSDLARASSVCTLTSAIIMCCLPLRKQLVETWYSKSPSSLTARRPTATLQWQATVHNDDPKNLPDPEKAFKWDKI